MNIEVPYIETLRHAIEEQYRDHPTGCGGSFGELLCHELHGPSGDGLTFVRLAEKWGITVTALGELIYDHCKRMEPMPCVNHDYAPEGTIHA